MSKIKSLVFILFFCLSIAAHALEISKVQIHGYGGWAYGKTDENPYLVGTEEGDFEFAQFSLNLSANLYENLRISAQVEWITGPLIQ